MKVFKTFKIFIIITISCIAILFSRIVKLQISLTPKCLSFSGKIEKENVTGTLLNHRNHTFSNSVIGLCDQKMTISSIFDLNTITSGDLYVNFNYSVTKFHFSKKIPKDCEKPFGISRKKPDYFFCDFISPKESLLKDLCRKGVIFCLKIYRKK